MTAIAFRDGVMAADSAAWTCGFQVIVPTEPKIKRLPDGSIFACAGSTSEIRAVEAWMRGVEARPKLDKEEGLTCLWARTDGSLWLGNYTLDFYKIVSPIFAIGASDRFMMGALFAGASAEETVRLAIEYTDGAAGSVQVERVCGG